MEVLSEKLLQNNPLYALFPERFREASELGT